MKTLNKRGKGKTAVVKGRTGRKSSQTIRAASTAPRKGLTKTKMNGFDVRGFCKRYRMARPDLTRLTGYSLRAVDKWAKGDQPAAPAKRQISELTQLFDALSEIMETKEVGSWLKTSNPAFDGSTPLQVIERGESGRIWRMIYQIETGEPV